MLIQDIDSERKLIYTGNPDKDYHEIGKEFGICDENGNASDGCTISSKLYTNANGLAIRSWELFGRSVTLVVVSDHVDGVHDVDSMVTALNSFNNPVYKFDKYVFSGKFKRSDVNLVMDKVGRTFTMNMNSLKDMPGIYNLMANIGANNGKLFEPLLARFVTAAYSMKNLRVQPIGYFDLREYLRIIKDSRADLFSQNNLMTRTCVAVDVHKSGCTVSVVSIDRSTNTANLSLNGATVVDAKKVREFEPHVIVSKYPFMIRRDTTFQSTPVMLGKRRLFLTPLMSKPTVWTTLQGGVNLLSTIVY